MNTLKTLAPAHFAAKEYNHISLNPIKLFIQFADGQEKNHTLWWFVNLMVHGNLILALPAVLIYYYQAPIWVLAITVVLFFANLVANMCGSGIRVTLGAFFISLFVNISMLLIYVL